MTKKIVILTATYNRPGEIVSLYTSLQAQKDQDFSWVVVNDGSGKETEEVLEGFRQTASFDLQVITQKNGGKSSAINNGLSHLGEDTGFAVIVDDDECLDSDAVSTVKAYYEKYKDTGCGVIHFNRKNQDGEMIASPVIEEDYFMSYQEFKSRKRHVDGYLGYFTEKLGAERFTIYEGEKYIGPSTLFMKVTRNSKLLFAKAALGTTEYLEGGITKQGRRLRIRNPQGMIEYCQLMQENGADLRQRFLYSVHGWAYVQLAKEKGICSQAKFMLSAKIPGTVLAGIWKKKYHD